MNTTKHCGSCYLAKLFEELEHEKTKLFKLNQLRESKSPIIKKINYNLNAN